MLDRLANEPALTSGLVTAAANLLVVFGVVNLSGEQVAAVNAALVAVLAVFVRRSVTPTRNLLEGH
jgi:hypothetical protein